MFRDLSLDNLVDNGAIKDYIYDPVNEDGIVGKIGRFRNTQQLTIVLNCGRKITINCFCSGSSQDTTLDISTS